MARSYCDIGLRNIQRLASALALTSLAVGTIVYSPPASAADIIYEYDAQGRLVKVTYPSGKIVTYTYDAAGNLVSVVVTP